MWPLLIAQPQGPAQPQQPRSHCRSSRKPTAHGAHQSKQHMRFAGSAPHDARTFSWHWLARMAAFSSVAVFCRCATSSRSPTGDAFWSSNASSAIVRSVGGRVHTDGARGRREAGQQTVSKRAAYADTNPYICLPPTVPADQVPHMNSRPSGGERRHMLHFTFALAAATVPNALPLGATTISSSLPSLPLLLCLRRSPSSCKKAAFSSPTGARYSCAKSSASSVRPPRMSSMSRCCCRWKNSSSCCSRICRAGARSSQASGRHLLARAALALERVADAPLTTARATYSRATT